MLTNLKMDASNGLEGRKMEECNQQCCLACGKRSSLTSSAAWQEDCEFSANLCLTSEFEGSTGYMACPFKKFPSIAGVLVRSYSQLGTTCSHT